MRRHSQPLLADSLLQADLCGILVLGSPKAIVDKLRLVPVRDLVFGCSSVEESLEIGERSARVTFERSSNVDEERVLVHEFPSDDGVDSRIHGDGLAFEFLDVQKRLSVLMCFVVCTHNIAFSHCAWQPSDAMVSESRPMQGRLRIAYLLSPQTIVHTPAKELVLTART